MPQRLSIYHATRIANCELFFIYYLSILFVFFTLIEPQVFASHSTLFTTYLFHRFLEATCLPFRAVFCPPKIAALLAKQFFVPHCGFRLVYVGVFDDAIAQSAI